MADPIVEPVVPATETVLTDVKDSDVVAKAAEETEVEETLLGDEKKVEEKTPVAEVVTPEKYEFKVPEGMEVDAKLVETLTPIMKDLKLSQEQAQKLVDAYAPYIQQQAKAQTEKSISEYKSIVNEWKTEAQKELGADADKKLSLAAKAINKFGSPELRTLLNETGVGNHKELVNFFIKVGTMISEDTFAEPHKQSNRGAEDMNILYPTMQK